MRRTLTRSLELALLVLLLAPAAALASRAVSAPTLVFPWQQVWPIVIGGLAPLATYALNHVGPWVSEPAKAAVLVVVSAAATALYTAAATSVLGFNDSTLQLLLTGVGSALLAHHWLWKPAGISAVLGGGSNRRLKKPPAVLPPGVSPAPVPPGYPLPVANAPVAAPPAPPPAAPAAPAPPAP